MEIERSDPQSASLMMKIRNGVKGFVAELKQKQVQVGKEKDLEIELLKKNISKKIDELAVLSRDLDKANKRNNLLQKKQEEMEQVRKKAIQKATDIEN